MANYWEIFQKTAPSKSLQLFLEWLGIFYLSETGQKCYKKGVRWICNTKDLKLDEHIKYYLMCI